MPPLVNAKHWSVGDVVAGTIVAATSLPQYIAYAELAGLAGIRGVKTSGPPIIAFSFLTTSPSLCVGVTSITALMAHATLNGAEFREKYGDERWMDLLGCFSVMVGLVSMLLALLGAARLAKRIPGSVKSGWKLGFATTVVAAQTAGAVFNSGASAAKKLVPIPASPLMTGGTVAMYRLAWMLTHPFSWDMGCVALSVLTLIVVMKCKQTLQKIFRLVGVEVIIATIGGTLLALAANYRGDTVGAPPAQPTGQASDFDFAAILTGWVRQWPWDMPWATLFDRLGGVHWALVSTAAFAAVDFLAIISVVPEGPSNELAGQGVGCVVSGMVGSAPIGGSLSRSLVADMTGASSPLMGLTSGLVTLLLALPQVAALLAPTPKAVLAAIVLAAVLPGVVNPKDVLKLRGIDAVSGWATAIASCLTDPTKGFGIGLVVHAVLAGVVGLVSSGEKKTN
eukprot:TRINITY_DN3656_c0_g1_i1.p1 TRINITY_DN3656_c0_g1~~TRINITY_DN3656_c0_g1_i1.p1  ORF type:complete len:452 (-),score=69.87 TRINITY_DN3656_c0_g1_i1:294-1649(-)